MDKNQYVVMCGNYYVDAMHRNSLSYKNPTDIELHSDLKSALILNNIKDADDLARQVCGTVKRLDLKNVIYNVNKEVNYEN
ncbi:hypothetical protein DS832_04760 [Bombilactobacillus bombi]|uniref:Uncharacterized protein n=1 Tax=Bombilactobacillus bombi TaxID=1303590 RepID=A0A417Z840_9LACO|nr:hypothetical protein [Bombilactobacillus bombi]RHW46802.1 hypothetical protein DS832_04760 [Bombilactobacillus bombi]